MPELVTKLERRPGEKESRFAHLLSGAPSVAETHPEAPVPARTDRLAVLEAELNLLKSEVEELKQQFAGFRRQFE